MTLTLENVLRLGSRARRATRGATAVEYALAVPALILLTLGIGDVGRLMFTQVALDRAVHAAARCAAVDAQTCGSPAQTQAYAVTQAFGLATSTSAFTAATAACGEQVTASVPFNLFIPGLGLITLTASACHPSNA